VSLRKVPLHSDSWPMARLVQEQRQELARQEQQGLLAVVAGVKLAI
jgi:hypothetical protein